MAKHGTNTMYHYGKCRCDLCRKAHAEANKLWARKQPKVYKERVLKDYRKNCELCEKEFKVRDKSGMQRYRFCSRECGYKGRVLRGTFSKGHPDLVPKESRGHSEETKAKMREINRANAKRGEANPLWKGGNKTRTRNEMQTWEYREWRQNVFARDNYTCQMCEQHGGALHADHIEKWSDNEELRYAVDNGRTLCVACHYYITFKKKMKPGQRWCNFTAGERG